MTPDQPELWNDPHIQARIVAWILGEASDFEIAELQDMLGESPELQAYYDRMVALHTRLEKMESVPEEPWTIEKGKRDDLLKTLGVKGDFAELVIHKPSPIGPFVKWGVVGAAAGLVMMGIFSLKNSFFQTKASRIIAYSAGAEEQQVEVSDLSTFSNIDLETIDLGGSESRLAAIDEELRKQEDIVAEKKREMDAITRTRGIYFKSNDSGQTVKTEFARKSGPDLERLEQSQKTLSEQIAKLDELRGDARTHYSFAVGQSAFAITEETPGSIEEAEPLLSQLDDPIRTNPAIDYGNVELADSIRQGLYAAEGHYNLGEFDKAEEVYQDVLRTDGYNQAARRGLEKVSQARSDYYRSAYDQARPKLLTEVDSAWELTIPKDAPKNTSRLFCRIADSSPLGGGFLPSVELPLGVKAQPLKGDDTPIDSRVPELGQGSQSQRIFKSEISASEEAFSTFSLNVSDVSFKLAAAALQGGRLPEQEKVRVEEFVNAFDYDDESPKAGQPVACAIEQSAHPFLQQRNLFRFGVRTAVAGRGAGVPLRLTILLDQSGSMERADRQASLLAGVKVLTELLGEADEVSLVGFSRTPRLLVDRVNGANHEALLKAVKQAPSEGGTNLEEALRLAQETALKQFQKGAQNRIVLITDGAANLGDADPASLSKLIEGFREQGIAFDTCGVSADDLNDELLEEMSRKGDGRYYLLDRVEDADAGFARQLAGAFRPAAENVKVQIVFNPERVGNYQLMGYEKHKLNKEDFRNDSVDAAELAAEESGVALYHAEIKAEGQGEVGQIFVRFRDVTTGKIIERQWIIPYQPQVAAFEKATPSLQLAATAAFVGEYLSGSPLGQQVDFGVFKSVLSHIRAAYPKASRVETLSSMLDTLAE